MAVNGQVLSNLRMKSFSLRADSVQLDTLSIAPNSFSIRSVSGNLIDTSAYSLDFVRAVFRWKKNSPAYRALSSDSCFARYRVFSFLLSSSYQHKNIRELSDERSNNFNPFSYNPSQGQPDLFKYEGLSKSGSLSRGVTFGNNQDVFVNSSLNLQLAGKISDKVQILAAITDENIPVQPEGNTQQLQDFDRVYIQLSDEHNKLIAGDFELRRPDSYFMNFFKKGQGGYFTSVFSPASAKGKKRIVKLGASLAVSKGKFARNTVNAIEGNQGPYKLQGSNGENFIIILAGTEKVYLDGMLLSRGTQYDYVIDYNTAELTFTARRIITKDSRIVTEFEYSDKNYTRSLFYFNNEFESERLKLKLNLYSEQDAKNQPLLQDLDSSRIAVMAAVGDSIQNAFFPTSDSIAFTADQVLYSKKDTTTVNGTYSIFLYSTNSDSAHWRVTFTDVGTGNGDYIQDLSPANGRVFRWVEPAGGVIHQGNFRPEALLITPRKQQLVTLGAAYQLSRRNSISTETALSNYDPNLFSHIDKRNDVGMATHVNYQNLSLLGPDSVKSWKLISNLDYEFAGKDFKPVERYRNVEFNRDWNLGIVNSLQDEQLASLKMNFLKTETGSLSYQFKSFFRGNEYKGLMHGAGVRLNINSFKLIGDGSYLTSDGTTITSDYLRHNLDVSRPVYKFILGIKELQERNQVRASRLDSLSAASFYYQEISGYISTQDSSATNAMLSYKQRYDYAPVANDFVKATFAREANLSNAFLKNKKNTLRTTTTYRKLEILDTIHSTQAPSETILNRIEHLLSVWNGMITANTFYEVGTGQERKQEYYYLEVPAGQGVYTYVGDANNNGVKDLDEFAISSFADRATFIRVYIPTNDYIAVRNNQLSEILTVTPAALFSRADARKNFVTRFSDQLSLRLDKKTQGESLASSLNPFGRSLSDQTMIAENSNFRNTIYFNRSNPVYGLDYTFQQNENKNVLTNGIESRKLVQRVINLRWNFTHNFLFSVALENGMRRYFSEYFLGRNYHLITSDVEPKISFQPGSVFRLTGSYKASDKKNNQESSAGEKVHSDKFGLELKYNTANTGSLSGRVNYINVKYNAPDNSILAYELLEGLKAGKNMTWSLSFQRLVGKSMQLNFNYEGRKVAGSNTVHTGGVQFRAYF